MKTADYVFQPLEKNRRILAVSDIHGNGALLKKLLEQGGYTPQDYLFIVGDLTEKGGGSSIETLQYIMELQKKGPVFALRGNCDLIAGFIKTEDYNDYFRFALGGAAVNQRILREMCFQMGIELNENTDVPTMKKAVYENYRELIDWLDALPHIIETQDFIFAHAGIQPGDLKAQDWAFVTRAGRFFEQSEALPKYTIVGHFPVVNYSTGILSANPRIDKDRKIIAIDGGNAVKSDGQLNLLIVDKSWRGFNWISQDNLPKAEIQVAQQASETPIAIIWGNNKIAVIDRGAKTSKITHLATGKVLHIPNDFIYEKEDGTYLKDYTDYRLPAAPGDRVSVCRSYEDRFYAKKDGVYGWIYGNTQYIS